MRSLVCVVLLGGLLGSAGRLLAAADGQIMSDPSAVRHGLTQAWVTQIQMDRGRGRVRDVVLYEGTLYVQTTRAMIHAIDAETGQTLWAKQVGQPDHPSLAPGVYRDLLATVNGSRLYIVNRYTGDVLSETLTDGAPGAGAALSSKRCYLPTVTGLMLAHRIEPLTDPLKELGKIEKKEPSEEEKKALEEERRQNIRIRQDYVAPLASQSSGRILVQPIVTLQNRDEEYCAWGTDRGDLNIARVDRTAEDGLTVKHTFHANQAILATPSYMPPDPKVVGDSGTIYATSCDGFIYAVLEKTGELLWKFSAGEAVVEPAALIEDRVFAATQFSGMYCLDAKSGRQLWWTPDIRRFLAAGKQRVYAADELGRVRILDGKTGAPVDSLPTESLPLQVANTVTDRLYVGTDTGMLECLHEIDQPKPIIYGESRQQPSDDVLPKVPSAKVKSAGEDTGDEKPAAKPKAPKAPPPAVKPKVTPKKAKDDDALGGGDAAAAADAPAAADDKPAKAARTPREKKVRQPRTPRVKKGKDAPDAAAGGL